MTVGKYYNSFFITRLIVLITVNGNNAKNIEVATTVICGYGKSPSTEETVIGEINNRINPKAPPIRRFPLNLEFFPFLRKVSIRHTTSPITANRTRKIKFVIAHTSYAYIDDFNVLHSYECFVGGFPLIHKL